MEQTTNPAPLVAALTADLASGAIDRATHDAQLAKLQPATPAATDPPPVASASPAPADTRENVPLGQAGLPSSDAEKMAAHLKEMLDSGRMSPDDYAKALAESGVEPAKSLSPEEIEFSTVYGESAKSPQDFKLPNMAAPNLTEEQVTSNTLKVAGWLHAAELTPSDGSALAKQIDRVAARLAKMSEGERVMHGRTELEKIRKIFGAQTDEKFSRVRQLLHELDSKPAGKGVLEFVRTTRCADDCLTFTILAKAADRAHARAEMRAKKK